MKRAFWILVLPALVFAGTVLLAGVAKADFLDEFNSPYLDPGWRINFEDTTHWSLTARPGFLRIITKYYTNGDTMWNGFYHVEAIPGNFEVSVKLIAHPDSTGQLVALEADYDSMYSGAPRAIVGIGNVSPYGRVVFGIINDTLNGLLYSDTLVYLRIMTSGDTVFASYSPDTSNWTLLKSGYPFIGHQRSGVIAINDSTSGGTRQTPGMNADFDWFHLVALTGVEEGRGQRAMETRGQGVKATPNPFTSFARIPGHEAERFNLYDISGRKVGTYFGNRIGEGLAAEVYFLRSASNQEKPLRIVKVK